MAAAVIDQGHCTGCGVRDLCHLPSGPCDALCIVIGIHDLCQKPCPLCKAQLCPGLVRDGISRLTVPLGKGELLSEPQLVLPFPLVILRKVMDGPVTFRMGIVHGVPDLTAGDGLVAVQPEAPAVSQVLPVRLTAVVDMGQAHRQAAAAQAEGLMLQDQVACIVIDMDGACTARGLAVVSPEALQARIVHILDQDMRAEAGKILMDVCRCILRIMPRLRMVLHHQPIVLPVHVPVLHQVCDVKALCILSVCLIDGIVDDLSIIPRSVVPCQCLVVPAACHLVHIDISGGTAAAGIFCQPEPCGCDHLVRTVDIGQLELHVASQGRTVHTAGLQQVAVIKVVPVVIGGDMAVPDLVPVHRGGDHRVDHHRIDPVLRSKPFAVCFQSHIDFLVLLPAAIGEGQCQATTYTARRILHIRCRQSVGFHAFSIFKYNICAILSGSQFSGGISPGKRLHCFCMLQHQVLLQPVRADGIADIHTLKGFRVADAALQMWHFISSCRIGVPGMSIHSIIC